MKRLVCVVEGHGEVEAIPNLCNRIRSHLGVDDWFVDDAPIKRSWTEIVDQRPAHFGRCREVGLRKALGLARGRRADAVLLVFDQDDVLPCVWGPHATQIARSQLVGEAVMAVREYESWLLWSQSDKNLALAKIKSPESKRGAKEALKRIIPNYLPTTHQLRLTRQLDIDRVWARSDSFDKLVRSLARLFGRTPPPRPLR